MKIHYILGFLLLSVPVLAVNQTTYSADGNYVVPANVSFLFVQAWGGGGAGYLSFNADVSSKGGGAGGGYSASLFTVSFDQNYTVDVGEGGTAITTGSGGSGLVLDGNDSNFSLSGVSFVLAKGGAAAIGVSGGSAVVQVPSGIGQVRYGGGSGGGGNGGLGVGSGAGGGGAGSLMNGTIGNSGTGSGGALGGYGGNNSGGNGGGGSSVGDSTGIAGSNMGGGGGGSYCDGGCGNLRNGGAGGRGQVIVNAYSNVSSLIVFYVRSISSSDLISSQVNITLQSPDNLITYNFDTSSGIYLADNVTAGTYLVSISSSGYATTYDSISVVENTSQSATYYLDADAQSIAFIVTDTLGRNVQNATASFSRNVNGSIVVVSQLITDFTGSFSVNLNTAAFYSVVVGDNSGLRRTFSGTIINPSTSNTYNIVMQVTGDSNYNLTANNTYTRINATYFNTSHTINVTWEVISPTGSLNWFNLNTTYNGTSYSQNISGSPGGGIAVIRIENVSLLYQDQINVTFSFQNNGYPTVSFVVPFKFIDFTANNQSIVGGLFGTSNAPAGSFGRVLLGMILLTIGIAGAYAASGSPEFAGIFGAVLVGVFSLRSVALFNPLFGLITIAVVVIVIFSKVIR